MSALPLALNLMPKPSPMLVSVPVSGSTPLMAAPFNVVVLVMPAMIRVISPLWLALIGSNGEPVLSNSAEL